MPDPSATTTTLLIGDERVAGSSVAVGREGLEAFQETKHVHMESGIERKEWWYPYREYGAQ